jgi:hypothetical protein
MGFSRFYGFCFFKDGLIVFIELGSMYKIILNGHRVLGVKKVSYNGKAIKFQIEYGRENRI